MAVPYGVRIKIEEGEEPLVYFAENDAARSGLDIFYEEYNPAGETQGLKQARIIACVDAGMNFSRSKNKERIFDLTKEEFDDNDPIMFIWCISMRAGAI